MHPVNLLKFLKTVQMSNNNNNNTFPAQKLCSAHYLQVLSPAYFPMYFVRWWEYFVWC